MGTRPRRSAVRGLIGGGDQLGRDYADGWVGGAGAAGLDVSGKLTHERRVGIDGDREIVPAGSLAQVADEGCAVVMVEHAGVPGAGVAIDNRDFYGAGTVVAQEEYDTRIIIVDLSDLKVGRRGREAASKGSEETVRAIDRVVIRSRASGTEGV